MDHFHYYFYEDRETLILLKQIIKQNKLIMATIQDLTAKVQELQTALDEEQAQVKDAIAALNEQIQLLKDQIAAGSAATPEQLQEIVDSLESTITDLKGTA